MANWDKISSRGRVLDRRSAVGTVGGLGLTGILLLMGVQYLLGGNPLDVLVDVAPSVIQQQQDPSEFAGEDPYEQFAAAVLGSANNTWSRQLAGRGRAYAEPKLVLFRQATQSGCGFASSEIGPHYCPVDNTIYLDETFFDELTQRFGAQGGDVAEAYVIAHEVGHHVQNQTGVLEDVQQAQQTGSPNAQVAAIALELQADCYAGVWASSLKGQGVLEPDEIREAMDAAAAVGDDRIQEVTTGQVNPESWTHGSSEQRVSWFNRGYATGDMQACNTFDD